MLSVHLATHGPFKQSWGGTRLNSLETGTSTIFVIMSQGMYPAFHLLRKTGKNQHLNGIHEVIGVGTST